MLKKLLLFFLMLSFLEPVICQQNYFQQQVNYKIDVTLNDIDNTLNGFEIIEYTNHSPDTLHFIWFHLWPNAYKNDKTAFSEQLLQLGRTDFYFSDNEKRGYINRLDFKVDGVTAELEDHPQYIDVAKLILPAPLAPGQAIKITTPFHEKIPYNFSRGGYVDHTYQITQWYPKPAVYDRKGWHAMPYLDQGEFYSEFGNYEVQITLPEDYVVAATGEAGKSDQVSGMSNQQSAMSDEQSGVSDQESAIEKSKSAIGNHRKSAVTKKKFANTKKPKTFIKNKKALPANPKPVAKIPLQNRGAKTLHFTQDNVHDFAWFADKNFIKLHDTLQLPSGRIIHLYSFFTPKGKEVWRNSLQFIKDAVRTRSEWLGEYPYDVVTAVEAKMGFGGGMEYPTITSISPMGSKKSLDKVIEHEVGHNWNYGILANNERQHPWMDEGMNTYFDNRYIKLKYPSGENLPGNNFINSRVPESLNDLLYRTLVSLKKDQPIETPSADFSELNYDEIAYHKTGEWMKLLEEYVGQPLFDSVLHAYYERWKFKHPYPEDFKEVVEEISGKNVDSIFSLLSKKGTMTAGQKKKIKVKAVAGFKETEKYNYIFIAPSIGINYYDKVMLGGIIHNYTLPEPPLHFFIAPMYATGSARLTGIGKIGYNIMSYGLVRKTELSISGETFSMNDFTDSTGTKNYLGFSKIVPSVRVVFKNKSALSTLTKSVQWKTFFIRETALRFARDTVRQLDVISYPRINRYVNQLKFSFDNTRVLYPYSASLQGEQAEDFVRVSFDGSFYFNYAKDGGLNVRLFAGKFIYLGDKTILKQFETERYHLNMTGANGYEDYTYSNYFYGRNEFQKFPSQQIMIRDGGFKVRTDLLASKIGKTDNWLAAANFNTDFPAKLNPLQVLPIKIPLKIFLDAGTYAEAWKKDAPTGKFIYDAGLQVSVLKDMVNIYFPLLYSKVYDNYFKSTIPGKRFWKNISFSIDIQKFSFSKLFHEPGL